MNSKNKKPRAVFPGSFDPFTVAHMELLEEASRLFDVTALVCANQSKGKGMFTPAERVEMISMTGAKADVCDGLVGDYCADRKIQYVIRGLRHSNASEEIDLSRIYHQETGIRTVFFPSYYQDMEIVSSTRVRNYISLYLSGQGVTRWAALLPEGVRSYVNGWVNVRINSKNI